MCRATLRRSVLDQQAALARRDDPRWDEPTDRRGSPDHQQNRGHPHRRGHSRSRAGDHPGSLGEDADDLATLIEHLGGPPVHLVGNSYGASVVLTLLATRPDLVVTAAVHEPPLFALLESTKDPRVADALASVQQRIGSVASLIESGDDRGAAEHFVDNVATLTAFHDGLTTSTREG